MGEAKVSLPGGCAIGTRPVDLLIMAMEKLGAQIDIDGGYVIARAKNGLKGGEIKFPKVTVSGTHTALMARGAGARHDGDRQRRAGARDRRRRRLPQQDGRADLRHRHLAADRRGRDAARRRAAPRAARPHRDRHLCDGGGDDRRRRAARGRAAGAAAERARRASSRPAPRSPPTNDGIRVKRNGSGIAPVDVDHRAVPRLSRPICRRSSWR